MNPSLRGAALLAGLLAFTPGCGQSNAAAGPGAGAGPGSPGAGSSVCSGGTCGAPVDLTMPPPPGHAVHSAADTTGASAGFTGGPLAVVGPGSGPDALTSGFTDAQRSLAASRTAAAPLSSAPAAPPAAAAQWPAQVQTTDGETISFRSGVGYTFRGTTYKYLAVDAFMQNCTHCFDAMPGVQSQAARFAQDGVLVLGLSKHSEAGAVAQRRARMTAQGVSYPWVMGESIPLGDAVASFPSFVIASPEGAASAPLDVGTVLGAASPQQFCAGQFGR
jgi:hypothetical protein